MEVHFPTDRSYQEVGDKTAFGPRCLRWASLWRPLGHVRLSFEGVQLVFRWGIGRFSWRYFKLPCSEKSETTWSCPRSSHLVVSSPSSPTGPRAWIRDVLIPTAAPAGKEGLKMQLCPASASCLPTRPSLPSPHLAPSPFPLLTYPP